MNFETFIQENANKIDWQPIETLPWELNEEYDPPRKYMPSGIILRMVTADGDYKYELIGDDIAGERTQGCSCCSSEWEQAFKWTQYNGWVWAFGENK